MIDAWGIRARVMLVALLPMLVLAIVLTAFYTRSRVADHEEAYQARGQAFARQLAAASEYALFSGNRDTLQRLAMAMLAEDDVTGVLIVDRGGETLARSGYLDNSLSVVSYLAASPRLLGSAKTLRVIEPVLPSTLNLDDDMSTAALGTTTTSAPPTLGAVIVDISRARLDARQRELLLTGSVAIVLVLVGSMMLANYMSRGVTGPIRQVAVTVERIGRGQFSARVPPIGGGTLRTLADGVNQMATQLASAHDDMSRQIAEATAELRASRDEAERATQSKSRFLAAASHDLRQPMHALGLFIAELAQHEHAPDARRLVERIGASAAAMGNLLDSLLDISRLDANVVKPNVRPFPLQPLLDRIAADEGPGAEEYDLELRARPTDAWISSDPVLFERILSNLVSNAVRYTRKGRVLVVCRRRGDRLRVEVRDNGIGIPAESHEVIFQEFTQLHNPERSRDKGLGLGLPIVRRLTELLGHRLTLRSSPGAGSVFAVEVPLAKPEADVPAAETERLPGDLGGLRVALVDDDPLARGSMESLLTSWGCSVAAAGDVEALVGALNRDGTVPQLIISDFRLDGRCNGIEVIRSLRTWKGGNIPAVLVTGDTGPDTLRQAQDEGLPLLHKPVRPARLRALLNRLPRQEE
ncbi:ATP-binding protein [Azoarcus sp. DN11]|uniref:hybrid sensor histidine kinase/response regulator n=1 Tax=Azoarcus sp. DN11 TaxID=356837 RepID=UPI000EAE9976|nr:ATP-binding protein [Azoarcus sp. DN11]AYH45565.1 hybrid sensor histidine kinase/response regulator [Azoarcus sp. DN11]